MASGSPGHARELARTVALKYERIVAVGGDGTVSEVADGVLSSGRTELTIGVVPLGSGNDFARALGFGDEEDTMRALGQGRRRLVDVMQIQCSGQGKPSMQHALQFVTAGVAAQCVKLTTPRLKRWLGARLAYSAGVIRALWQYSFPVLRVTCDGECREEAFLFVCASNTETFGGGMQLAPGAQLDDGQLEVTMVQRIGRWEALGHFGKLWRGTHVRHPKVNSRRAQAISIESSRPMEVAADGDLVGWTPARIGVRPKAIAVLAP